MAERFGLLRSGSFGSGPSGERSSILDEDFDEEEVWSVIYEKTETTSPKERKPKDPSPSSPSPLVLTPAKRFPTATRMIPRVINSLPTKETKLVQQSAPVNIPDWSKIYGKSLKRSVGGSKGGSKDDLPWAFAGFGGDDESGDVADEYDGKIPPHEWIAKKVERSQVSSFSVLEGVGRTLKGRDLSKVRNAVLSRTGFLE